MTEPPLVSIVIATFNRSAALRCALSSVSKQTVTEWETIVVGDCCTDDTADVVGSFDDPRIGFINLPVNFGEQSGPNNVGIERSRARLIAFLNHDDLWLPNHLEHSLVALHARCADLVFGPNLNIVPGAVAGEPPIVIVDGLSRAGRYDPRQIDRATVASTWVVRREALERLRGWRSAAECRIEPSQDLLFRAHRMGMRMFSTGSPTVISIPSGVRRGSYLRNAADEQERLVTRLDDPLLPVELLASDPTSCAPGPRPTAALRSRVWRSSITPLAALGISPRWVDYTIRRRLHRGEHLDALRRHRGLDVIPPAGSNVAELRRRAVQDLCVIPDDGCIEFVTAGNGVRFMATGWSHPERWGTWNDGTTAALMFRTDGEELPDTARARLTVTAHADDQHPVQRVRAEVAGTQTAITLTGSGPHTIELDVGPIGRQPSVVKFHFSDAWRPRGPDSRCLAIGLISAVFV